MSEWSIRWVSRNYFINISTRDVGDVSYYVWIRGVAWPRVSTWNIIDYNVFKVQLLAIDDSVKQGSRYLHQLYNNYDN